MLEYFTAALPHFFGYFGAAAALAVVFLVVYSWCTPHREFALIREGNSAAAVQLTGTFIGFTLPVAIVISNSVNVRDMLLWGIVAGAIQLLVFLIVSRFLFRAISQKITEDCMASGLFVGGTGLGFGILQAACMVP